MRHVLTACLLGLLLHLPLRAEEAPSASVRAVDGTLSHGGRARNFRVLVPASHERGRPVPLVLALHGGGGTATGFDRSTRGQFAREAGRRGWIVAFPQGVAKGWNDGRPLRSRRDRMRAGVDDVGFLATLVDHLHGVYGIDRERVYATGISNGGFMSFRLGLELSDRIAAIAPVTANLARTHDGKKPAHAVGLLVVNGTEDPLVPYDGGQVRVFGQDRGAIFSTDESMRRWAGFDGCTGEVRTTALPDRAPRDGTRAWETVWSGCESGVEVRRIRVEGGGHTWPGGRQYLPESLIGRVSRDFDAVPVIFDFFARHRRALSPRSGE